MNLIATMIFYQDAEDMERACQSVKAAGLDLICVDGKYNEFPGDNIASTDGSIDVAKQYADLYVPADESFLASQMTKRNRYLREITPGDYCLVIDTDEILSGGIPKRDLVLDTYALNFVEGDKDGKSTIRVHKKYEDLIYAVRHCYLYREKQMNYRAIELLKEDWAKWVKDKNPYDPGFFSKHIKAAFSGCKTTKWCPDILMSEDGSPITINHFPNKRPAKRQFDDSYYISNRASEININKFIPDPPESCISAINGKTVEFDNEDIVSVLYTGKDIFGDGKYGKFMPGGIYEMEAGDAVKRIHEFGYKWVIQDVVKRRAVTPEQRLNAMEKKMDTIIKLLESLGTDNEKNCTYIS